MSQSVDSKELEKLVTEQSETYAMGPTIALAYISVLKDCEAHCLKEGSEVKKLGGLHVIGTSLHESRRIDNQVKHFPFLTVLTSSFKHGDGTLVFNQLTNDAFSCLISILFIFLFFIISF